TGPRCPGLPATPPLAGGLLAPGGRFFTMRFLRFLRSAPASEAVPFDFWVSSFFFLGLLNWDRSILSPVILGPDSFWYWVLMVSEPWGASSLGASGAAFSSSLASTGASAFSTFSGS